MGPQRTKVREIEKVDASRYSGSREDRGDADRSFMHSLSLGKSSSQSGVTSKARENHRRPREVSKLVTTDMRHWRSRKRNCGRPDSSDSDSSDLSDSDGSTDEGEPVRITETYGPKGDRSTRRGDFTIGRSVGLLARAMTEISNKGFKEGVQNHTIGGIVEGATEFERGYEDWKNRGKPSRHSSFSPD